MKELQNRIMQMLKDRKTHSRAVALIAALSMITAFIVPYAGMVPGVAMTEGQTTAAEQMDDEIVTEETFTDLFEAEDTEAVQLSDESEDDDEEAVSLETVDMMEMAVKGLGNALLLANENYTLTFENYSNETETQITNGFFTITNNGNTILITSNGLSDNSYSRGVKVKSNNPNNTEIKFTPTEDGTLYLLFDSYNLDKNSLKKTIKINGTAQNIPNTTEQNPTNKSKRELEYPVSKGTPYTITQGDGETRIFKLQFIPTQTEPTPSYTKSTGWLHNFTENGLLADKYDLSSMGNIIDINEAVTIDNVTYSKELEFRNDCLFTFNAPSDGTLRIIGRKVSTNNRIKIGNETKSPDNTTPKGNYTIYEWENINSGNITISKMDSLNFLAIEFIPTEDPTPQVDPYEGKTYTIKCENYQRNNAKVDYYLTVNDNKLIQEKNTTIVPAHFEFELSDVAGYYYIKNLETGNYVTALSTTENGSNDTQFDFEAKKTNSEDQKLQIFKINVNSDDTVSFESMYNYDANTPLMINATHATGDKINKVSFYRKEDGFNEKFTLTEEEYTPPETPSNGSTGWQHNFTENGLTAANFRFDNNCVLNDIEPIEYDDEKSYTKELYFFPTVSPSFQFDAPSDGKLIIYNNKYADKTGIFISDDPNATTNPPETLPSTKEELVEGKLSKMEYEVSAGLNIIKPKYGQRLYYIEYVPYENTASSIQSGQAYTLHTNNGKGFVLSSDGTKLVQFPEDSAQDTTFVFEDAGDGSYYIKNGDKYVTIGATPTNNKESFKLEAKNNSAPDRQKFIVGTGKDDDGNTYFTFKSKQKNGDDEFYINATHSQDDTENNRVSPYTNTTGTHAGNQRFTLVPVSTENTAANLAGKTIMLRNVNSNLYLEAPDSNSTTGKLTQQNKGNDDEDQQFLLEDAGNGYYYIKSVGKSTAQNGKYVTIGTDGAANGEGSAVMLADKDTTNNRQKFKFTKNTDGSYTISPKSNEEMCIEIGSWATNAGATANQYWIVHPGDDQNDNEANKKFFMEVVSSTQSTQQTDTNTGNTPLDEGKIRIEARVIFGDYKDTYSATENVGQKNTNFWGLENKIYFQLFNGNNQQVGSDAKSTQVNKDMLVLTGDNIGTGVNEGLWLNGSVTAESYANLKNDEARKDWCYQYNHFFDITPDNNAQYYVKLKDVDNSNHITIAGTRYKVYYLRDTELNHPGTNGTVNAPDDVYKTDASSFKSSDSQIIYIFLFPDPNTPTTGKLDISMKKRWDGHNSKGEGNRPKEKIQIQLQRLINVNGQDKWVEYNPSSTYFQNSTDDKNYVSYINYEKDNIKDNFVNMNTEGLVSPDVPEEKRLSRTVNGVEEYWIAKNGGGYINKEVLAAAPSSKGEGSNYENVKREDRLQVALQYEEWNNVILSYDKGNKPSHFQKGYYMNWSQLPHGQYRVVETMSFYDVDDDDVYDPSKGDRDTSGEYFYMVYPPARDSNGVLHIQNFTKDMVLDVEKKWYSDEEATNEIPSPNNKPIVFDIYRSLSQVDEPSESMEYVGRYETGADGKIELKTTENDTVIRPELKLRNENGQKYFYYIKEVGVRIDGNTIDTSSFTQIGNNHNGFVASKYDEENEKWIYGADFEAGDGRKFFIKNQQHYGIKVEKKFKINGVDVPYSKLIGNKPEVKFELYGSPNMVSNPTINGLTKIGGERTITGDGDGTVRFLNTDSDLKNQIVVPEMFNGTKTYNNGNGGVFEPNGSATWTKNGSEDYYSGFKNNSPLWIKPNRSGKLVVSFTNDTDASNVTLLDKTNNVDHGNLTPISIISNSSEIVITYNLTSNITPNNGYYNFRLAGNNTTKLKSAVFYPDYYYYIRELPDSTGRYTLSNGDTNGFVQTNGTNYYLNLTSEAPFANATAINEPNEMQLSINKKWYKTMDGNAELTTDRPSSYFKLYKATAQMKTVNMAQLTQVTDFTGITLTGLSAANGIITKTYGAAGTIEDLPTYIQNGTVYNKLYYYIQEVDSNGNPLKGATLRNADSNDFIADAAGNYGSYLDEADAKGDNDETISGTARTYNFENVPTIDLKVKKTWGNGTTKKDEVTIYLYRSAQASNGTQSAGGSLMYSASPKKSASALIPDTQSDTDNTETNNTPISSNKILRAGTLKMVMNKLRTDDSVDTIDEALPETNDVHILYKAPRTQTNGVKLLADRVNEETSNSYYKKITLESSDVVGSEDWTIEVKDLPVYDSAGNVYNYWVEEDNNVAKNYNVNYIYNGSNGNGINASNPGNGSIEVINNDKSTDSIYLPEAGGNGTRIYYIASGIILLLTTLGYITYRSRKASLREE